MIQRTLATHDDPQVTVPMREVHRTLAVSDPRIHYLK